MTAFDASQHAPAVYKDPAATPARQWSPYQQDIYNWVETGSGNAIVVAVAGSGKTTTGVECVQRVIRQGLSHVFLAFNKSIAQELQARDVNGATFHSACMRVVMSAYRGCKVDADKLRHLCDENLSKQDFYLYATFVCDLVSKGKQAGIGCLVDDTAEAWLEIVDHHGLELADDDASLERAVMLASRLLDASAEDVARIDFDDMLYFVVRHSLRMPTYNWVFVDEGQDTNAIQRAIIAKLLRADSRLMVVGDPAQAIYGFRGADSDSLELIAKQFSCRSLPLTISYRCPAAVVKYAQQWVKHIECAPGAAEGAVTALAKWDPSQFTSSDVVGCRTTAPLIKLAYRMLKARLPVQVMGREIGAGLKALVRKLKPTTLDDLETKLEAWRAREEAGALAKGKEAKAQAINDKAGCISCLAEALPEDERTVDMLLDLINRLFSDKSNCVRLGTVHKLKGLEAPRVYWLNSSQCPSKWATKAWQQGQERNLCYVMTTRAMSELVLIEEK